MTRFTTFTDEELNNIEEAFKASFHNMSFDTSLRILKNFVVEIQAERELRKKAKEIERHRALKDKMERLAMNANYGLVTRSCDDDEKLVVLCMINKTLKDVQGTLEGMQETLARIDDKV